MTRRRTVRQTGGETDEQRAERLAGIAVASVRDDIERLLRDVFALGYRTALEESIDQPRETK